MRKSINDEAGIDLFPRSWVAFAEDPMRFPFQYQVHGVCCTYLVLNTQNFHSVLLNIFHKSFIFCLQVMWVGFTCLLTFPSSALFSSLFSDGASFYLFFQGSSTERAFMPCTWCLSTTMEGTENTITIIIIIFVVVTFLITIIIFASLF